MEAIIGSLILLVVVIIFLYNSLIHSKNRAEEAWSDIDVQLKRRYDLIPNLIEVVKGYATHEKELFENVTQARTQAMNNQGSPEEQAQSENMLQATLKSLFAVSENYPELKANENFLGLQDELVDTENKIQAARRFYNATVRELNTKIDLFPSNIIAGIFHFQKRQFFELRDDSEAQVVNVGTTLRKE